MKHFFHILLVSKNFLAAGLADRDFVVQVSPVDKYESAGPHYLVNFYRGDQKMTNLPATKFELEALLKIKQPTGIEAHGLPPIILLIDSCRRSVDFDPEYIRFFHNITKGLTRYNDRTLSIMPAPQVYSERVDIAPRFYHNIFAAFPIEFETFVFLPNLFVSDEWKECKDAAFEVIVVEADGKMRKVLSMKQNPNAENSIYDFCNGNKFDDIKKCEGLTFGTKPQFKDPKTKKSKPYAFKLNEEHVRLLIMVKCNACGVGLVDRIIQTARLYFSILGEMPSSNSFDIAVLINMSRTLLQDAQPFIFGDTIASKLADDSIRKVQLIEDIRLERSDLKWFTDFCSPHASGRMYAIDFCPMKRNLWILDVNPARYR